MSIALSQLRNRDRVLLVEPGRIHPAATFSRSTTGYYMGPGGVLVQAAANAPRFEYDAAGNYLGFLTEEARTNLCKFSDDFTNDFWASKANITVSRTQTAPDGSTNGCLITVVASGVATSLISSAIAATSTAMTYPIYVKAGTRTGTLNFLLRNSTTATNFATGVWDPTNGSITGTGWTSTSVGNGWYRLAFTQSTGITSGDNLLLYCGASGGTGYTAGDTWILWGAQLEAGGFATSYIPTTTATVTRAADILSILLSAIGYNSAASTFFAEHDELWTAAGGTRMLLALDTSGRAIYSPGSLNPMIYDGTNAVTATGGAQSMGKTVSAFDASGMAIVTRGGTVATGAFDGTFGAGSTTLNIGGISGGNPWCGHIKRAWYSRRRLPNVEMQALSA